ncbi:folylpolyglutamate synthase/dihydrofolate synthase family protein [Parabacteroides sp. PF5-6]|uniref:bifunctional folylpolyglutamate synthase/dihydrofolate synthase n=1 Tax=Parabacteroides sp. PF5-6 TaxID=1742403 RepID=UPI002405016F|nr:folylpolyglutamate synthase/dihydrofolate synthase family protein [Parabacteroides sp. PF5-6]MDF9830749.1 dihydrofolate synthase/folylpolyglutamate synthase [Parabacteroides sp. PF5-6]
MTYEETLNYLYTSTPVYQHSGASAYKPGLATSIALDNLLDHPHQAYKTIHVGGTNGKGSVCHTLAAVLQTAGYKVGLYTSPHLVDFRERIRVNGEMISEYYVVEFVQKYKKAFEPLHPSFFELTSSMAFDYFRAMEVDIALIEVGLGGRLDSTNIITPILSIITNISKDHTQFLGETIGEIAYEKAGIIKEGVPVVTGEMNHLVTEEVFRKKANEMHAPLYTSYFEEIFNSDAHLSEKGEWYYDSKDYGIFFGELIGLVQIKNTLTVLSALRVLDGLGIKVTKEQVRTGFGQVTELTGLQGRWQEVLFTPYTVLDTGHNPDAWEFLAQHINAESQSRPALHMVIGLSNDKDADAILQLMPTRAIYYFTQARTDRAMPAEVLAMKANKYGLKGEVYPAVVDAVYQIMHTASDHDMVFIGGSNFIVADALPLFKEEEDDNLHLISLS